MKYNTAEASQNISICEWNLSGIHIVKEIMPWLANICHQKHPVSRVVKSCWDISHKCLHFAAHGPGMGTFAESLAKVMLLIKPESNVTYCQGFSI